MTRSGIGRWLRGSLRALAAALALAVLAAPAQAQYGGRGPGPTSSPKSLAAPTTGAGKPAPHRGIGPPGETLVSPGINSGVLRPFEGIGPLRGQIPPALSAPPGSGLSPSAGQVGLVLSARFGEKAGPITGGLHWRVYPDRPDSSGRFNVVKEDRSANPTFVLPPGGYVVHVNAGLASAAKHVSLRAETVKQTFDIPAGGIRLEGRVGGVRIPAGQISFDVFQGSQFDAGVREPLTRHVMTGDVVMVPEGTYHIVSNYGDANAVIRSDIRVQAGKLTDVTVTHHAAVITLKLVSDRGGEALANTAWSVLTPGGDVVKESIGAFPRVILAEGDYRVIARNDGRVFQRGFKVSSGVDGEIEVLAR